MEIVLGSPLLDIRVDVRLDRRRGRWVAVAGVRGERNVGIGGTAHEALAASVSFLGRRTASALLADPGLMTASTRML